MQRKPVFSGLNSAPARRGFLLATTLPLCIATANAFELNFAEGEVTGRFDNTLSYGVAVRTQGADRDLAAETSGATDFYTELAGRNVKTQVNKNDGNTNFADPGDIVSQVAKINTLLEFNWKNYGAQFSGFAFHDKAMADLEGTYGTDRDFINNVDVNDRFTNERLDGDAADYAVTDARLSSAYVWGDFEVGGRTLNVRVGEQVLSWGEALFLQDGINQANPADLSALRLPGAEIKDALLPLPMLAVSASLTESLSAEAFYEIGWARSEADPVGSFYSTTDAFFGYGSEAVIVDLEGAGASAEQIVRRYNEQVRDIPYAVDDPMGTRLSNNKLDDQEPRDDGQGGLALRYMAENLNNTEFGFFWMNYHARKPTAGAVLGEAFGSSVDGSATCAAANQVLTDFGQTVAATCGDYLTIAQSEVSTRGDLVRGVNQMHYIDTTSYFLQYEQNLQVWGLTFSTNVGETSFSGEVAYRPDSEFLPEVGDSLIAYNAINASAIANNTGAAQNWGDHIGGGAALSAGQTVDVTADEDMTNVSLLAIHNFGPTWVMDGLTAALELGGAWVMGLDSNKGYAAEGALGYLPPPYSAVLNEGNESQYLDDFSWGYRLVVGADFNDVAAGLNLKPQLRFAHDVSGNSVVGGNFVEDRMSSTIAVEAEYLNDFTFALGANVFWGAEDRNQLQDRDNVYANVKYSF